MLVRGLGLKLRLLKMKSDEDLIIEAGKGTFVCKMCRRNLNDRLKSKTAVKYCVFCMGE